MGQDFVLLHVRVSTTTKRSTPPACQGCGSPLDLHQPSSSRPGEILGTCPDCGGWHFLGLDDNGHTRLLAHLPLSDLDSPTK